MASAAVFSLANHPSTELLDPYEIQRRRLSIQNALAAQQLQQQQIAGGAIALDQQQRAIAQQEQTRNALRAYYLGTAAPGTPAPGGVPPAAPPPQQASVLPGGPGIGSSAWSPEIASPAMAPALPPAEPAPVPAPGGAPPAVPPAPAQQAAPVSQELPTVGSLIQAGVDPIAAPGVLESFTKAAKETAEIQAARDKSNEALQNYASHMAAGVLKSGVNPAVLAASLQHFASMGPQYAQTAQHIASVFQQDPEAGKRLLEQTAVSSKEGRDAYSREQEVAATKSKADRENTDADVKQAGAILATVPNKEAWGAVLSRYSPEVRARFADIPWSQQAPAIAQQRGMSSQEQVTTAETSARDKEAGRHNKAQESIERDKAQTEKSKVVWEQAAIRRAGEALGHGELTNLREIASLRGDQRLMIYDIAKQINPAFNTSELDRKIKNEDYYYNGKGADNLRSFGTFLEHAGSAADAVAGLRLTGSPAINRPINWWRQHMTGDPAYTTMIGSLEPVRKEAENFLLSGHAQHSEDRAAAEKILSDDSTPATFEAALKVLGHTAVSRANEENFRYKKVSGHDLQDAFSPEARLGAQKIGLALNIGGSSNVPPVQYAAPPPAAAAPAPAQQAAPAARAPVPILNGKPLTEHSTDDLLRLLVK